MRCSLIGILLPLLATTLPAQSQSDFAGVDRFWAVAQKLSADSEPNAAEWAHLLNAPAYRALERDERLQRMMRLAFRPALRATSDSVLTAATYDARVIRHLRRALEQRADLQGFRDSLASIDLAAKGIALAAAYLPPGATSRHDPPFIAFGLFEPSAYGASTGITVDLLFARDRGPAFLPIVGHEVHHVYTAFLTSLRLPARTAPEYTLLQALRNLANEGTADRINLRFPVGPPSVSAEVAPAYNEAYAGAGSTLVAIDSLLGRGLEDSAEVRRIGIAISSRLVYAGHPVGAYMAERIEVQLGREALVEAVGNPFVFLCTFNEAARQADGSSMFSAASMTLLAVLEQRFTDMDPRSQADRLRDPASAGSLCRGIVRRQ